MGVSIRRLLVSAAVAAAAVGTGIALAARTSVPVTTGVVDIETNLAYQNASAAGTGMVLTSSGEVLTNNHVIRGATTIRVLVPQTGRTYTARVLGYDVADDVALLKLQGASGLKTVQLGDSSKVRRGQSVTAVGNAGGTRTLTVTTGTITAVGRTITVNDDQGGTERLTSLLQTNAGLQPGDSGGPLLDGAHRVIGVDTAASAGFVFQRGAGDGYAIPINRALAIAHQIEKGRASATVHVGATAFLGVSIGRSDAGAPITGVVPGSPADRAGLVPGDVITSFNGKAVASPTALQKLVLQQSPGAKVQVGWVDQSGTQQTATVTLASGPPQ
jgi:S1-C subfamily serine protease